ncbi:MAG: DUF669 domain-containing protein [Planctomycetaceae bacterium]|nr:DUF669 domain-containing protein [Planctomycetaceae bacterium]
MSNYEWLGFNPHETEAAESFKGGQKPIPNGKYKAIVTSAARKHTKSGKGWFWELTFVVAEGQYEGRTIVHRFNMVNPSEQAAEIGRRHMKRYLDAIGNHDPKDESELCNISVWIEVECQKNEYTNRQGVQTEGWSNEIVKIDPYSNAPSPPKAAATGQSSVPPWKR